MSPGLDAYQGSLTQESDDPFEAIDPDHGAHLAPLFNGPKLLPERFSMSVALSKGSEHFHAVVWIDHHEARVFHFSTSELERVTIRPDHPVRHLHHKAGCIGSGHEGEDREYLRAVAAALATAGAILIVGPGAAKQELVRRLIQDEPEIAKRVVGVESCDHPTDGQIAAYARSYFRAADRMTPQRV